VRNAWSGVVGLWPLGLGLLIVAASVFGWRFATAQEARLYALSATDGRVRWSAVLPDGTDDVGSPAVSDGRVVVLTGQDSEYPPNTRDWQLSAFDAASGRALWQRTSAAGPVLQQGLRLRPHLEPYATEDHAFFMGVSDTTQLAAFDGSTGRLDWAAQSILIRATRSYPPIVASAGRIVVPIGDVSGVRLVGLSAEAT
jgi:outer membrane protein assembly factor BamB